ncbi:MAG: hypothetical protein ACI39R_04585 [Lachnospiraceae bacterium]
MTINKIVRRVLPVVMTAVILITTLVPAPAVAVSGPSEKEEVIYINLTADGSVKEVYAVNIFGKGSITDYGNYSYVELLNTTDPISMSGDCITFTSSVDRVYYKGTMESTVIPWNISIKFFIDGKEYSADDVAGKSGKLEIRFSVTENEGATGDFFDSYALQANFTLDTEKCSNIVAPDGTLANVGSKKQISYTMLPGEGIDTVITADVTNFEMEAVSINGVPLSMNIEVDDEELMSQVSELIEAVSVLNDGAGELKDGADELKDGVESELKPGTEELYDGADILYEGMTQLQDGSQTLWEGTESIKDGASQLYEGSDSLNQGITLINEGLNELNEKSSELTGGSKSMKGALLMIQEQLGDVSASTEQLDELVNGSAMIMEGIDDLNDAIVMLEANVSFQSYKEAMKINGLDVDELQKSNVKTVAALNNQIEEIDGQVDTLLEQEAALNIQIAELVSSGENDTLLAVLQDQKVQLEQSIAQLQASSQQLSGIAILIQGNSGAIIGMENYLTTINQNIDEIVAGVESLKENYAKIDEAINTLVTNMKTLLVNLAMLKNGIDTLVTEYGKLDAGINEYTEGVAQIVAGYSLIVTGSGELLDGSRDLKDGTVSLYESTGEFVDGVTGACKATGTLKDGTKELYDGVKELEEGILKLNEGCTELSDGIGEMYDEIKGMDTEVSDKIDEMISDITGDNAEIVSFVSEKNTNVDAVQFVIQTEAVSIREIETVAPVVEEKLSLWQKILRLFGLY